MRGLIASMGAGLSLLVAGVLTLVFVSAVVAYRGLPGLAPSQTVSEVRLPDVPPPVREAGEASATRARASRARISDATRRGRDGAVARTARQQSEGDFVSRTRGTGRPAADAPGPVAQAVEPSTSAPAVDPAPVVEETQLVEDVTRQVQEVLDPVTRATERTTDAVTDAVDDTVTGVAGDLLKP